MENCRIIELEKEREEVQQKIGILQRENAERAILITQEWQKDAVIESQQAKDCLTGTEQPG